MQQSLVRGRVHALGLQQLQGTCQRVADVLDGRIRVRAQRTHGLVHDRGGLGVVDVERCDAIGRRLHTAAEVFGCPPDQLGIQVQTLHPVEDPQQRIGGGVDTGRELTGAVGQRRRPVPRGHQTVGQGA